MSLTRRQSQRRRLSRLVQSHESRQPPSWLIFDVRQMKALTTIVLTTLLTGCVSRREAIVVPPIQVSVDVAAPRGTAGENPIVTAMAKSVFGPETAVGQLVQGCGYFREASGRWPRTKDEVATGLLSANLSPTKLAHIEQIQFREDASSLILDFVSTENGRVQGTITLGPPRTNA